MSSISKVDGAMMKGGGKTAAHQLEPPPSSSPPPSSPLGYEIWVCSVAPQRESGERKPEKATP